METFLWVEKYRPRSIDECILPEDLKNTFSEFEKDKHINIVEIKNVVCASYDPKKDTYGQKTKFHDYKTPFIRAGVYPYGELNQSYKGKKVVSERSIKQIDFMKKHKDKYNFSRLIINLAPKFLFLGSKTMGSSLNFRVKPSTSFAPSIDKNFS